MKIGLIGPGRIGRPMLDRLAAAGHDVTVLVRDPQARAATEADGFTCADRVSATVRAADAVFVVVLTDKQVRSVCLGPDEGDPGRTAAAPAVPWASSPVSGRSTRSPAAWPT